MRVGSDRACGFLEAGPDALQRVCVPHVGVPALEPTSEGGRLGALLDGGDGNMAPPSGVSAQVVAGWKERKIERELNSRHFFQGAFLCSGSCARFKIEIVPIFADPVLSTSLASLPIQMKTWQRQKKRMDDPPHQNPSRDFDI